MRFILAVVIIAVAITYFVLVPLMPTIRRFFNKEVKRIDSKFNPTEKDDE